VRINIGDMLPKWSRIKLDTQAELTEYLQRMNAGAFRNGDDQLVHKLADLKEGGKYAIE
jgi:hypothetical protein